MKHDFDQFINRRGTDSKKYALSSFPEDCIPMWIADTDFKCPQPIIDAMTARSEEGIYGYPIESPDFAKTVVRWFQKQFAYKITEDAVKYVSGVLPGIVFALRAFSNDNDKILIQTPIYPPFRIAIETNKRRVVENPLILKDDHYEIDFDDLAEKLSCPNTKVMLLCNPHNPSGRVFTKDELIKIGELCLAHNVFVVSDEIHFDIIYKGHEHISFGSISKSFEDNSLTIINPSKTFNIAGLRTGAIIIPNEEKRKQIQEQLISNKAWVRPIFGVLGLEISYTKCDYYLEQMLEYLQGNRDYMLEYFAKYIPKIKMIKLEGTYLAWLDCRSLNMDQDKLKVFMSKQAKLGLNDGTSFGTDGAGFMRMNFACSRKILEEALTRLRIAVDSL